MTQLKKNVTATTRRVSINAESSVASSLLLNHQGKLWIERTAVNPHFRFSAQGHKPGQTSPFYPRQNAFDMPSPLAVFLAGQVFTFPYRKPCTTALD